MGFGPTTPGLKVQCSTSWATESFLYNFVYTPITPQKNELVCPLRGEQNTSCSPGYKPGVPTNCAIEALGRGGWIRTSAWRIQSPLPYHIWRHPCAQNYMVGMMGIEPTTSWSQTKRATTCATSRWKWSRSPDSDRGPADYKSAALPTELHRHIANLAVVVGFEPTEAINPNWFQVSRLRPLGHTTTMWNDGFKQAHEGFKVLSLTRLYLTKLCDTPVLPSAKYMFELCRPLLSTRHFCIDNPIVIVFKIVVKNFLLFFS